MNNRVINSRIDNIFKDISELKLTSNFHEELFDKKIENIQTKVDVIKEEMMSNSYIPETNLLQAPNGPLSEIKKKLVELEDRSRRNNLRIQGVSENLNEDWNTSKIKLKEIISKNLGLDSESIVIERAHRVGKKEEKKGRCIVAKFLNYEDKEMILKNTNKLKGTGVYINEDYSDETLKKELNCYQRSKNTENRENLPLFNMTS